MRKVIKKEQVRIDETAAALPSTHRPGATSSVPDVRVLRAGGRVHAVEVTCRCGERILLELQYEPAEPPRAPSPEDPSP